MCCGATYEWKGKLKLNNKAIFINLLFILMVWEMSRVELSVSCNETMNETMNVIHLNNIKTHISNVNSDEYFAAKLH